MARMGPTYRRSFSSYDTPRNENPWWWCFWDTPRKRKSLMVHGSVFGMHLEKQNPAGGTVVFRSAFYRIHW